MKPWAFATSLCTVDGKTGLVRKITCEDHERSDMTLPSRLRFAIPPIVGIVTFLAGLGITRWLVDLGPAELLYGRRPEDAGANLRLAYYLLHDVGIATYVSNEAVPGRTFWWSFDYRSTAKHPDFPTEPDTWWYLTPSLYRGTGEWRQLVMTPDVVPLGILGVLPVGLLVLGGAVAALATVRSNRLRDGAIAGAGIAIGYLLATVIGLHFTPVTLFSTPDTWIHVFPDPVVSIVRMGIAYPVGFGAVGGATAIGFRRFRQGRG